jgi:hypothetical protein
LILIAEMYRSLDEAKSGGEDLMPAALDSHPNPAPLFEVAQRKAAIPLGLTRSRPRTRLNDLNGLNVLNLYHRERSS